MPKASEIKKNNTIVFNGKTCIVRDIDRSVPQGRAGGSIYRMRMYDVVSGAKFDETFKDSDMLEMATDDYDGDGEPPFSGADDFTVDHLFHPFTFEAISLGCPDYEVVTGQAVKNLRHIDRGLLREKLAANANGVLRDAVWRDGVRQQNRDEFFRTLDGLGSQFEKRVVVFQPRVRKSVYETTRGKMDLGDKTSKDVRQLQQLDALLLGARADCYSLGAEFKVISDGDNLQVNP